MPQEYRPRITDEEASLLRAIPELYRLGGAAVDVKSYVVWGGRIVLAFYADGKRYFLKEWPEHVIDGDEVTFILKVQEYARRRGVPVPETLRTTGEQDVMLWGKRRLSLQRFVGEAYDPHRHWEQKLSCSKVLGLLHSTLEDSQFEHKKRPSDPFTSSRQFISDARSRQPKKELRAEHNKIVVCILEGFEEVLGLAEDRLTTTGWQDMPSMPIHGDYCQFNCRFSGNSVVGIVDWDLVRMAPRILDLAFFLHSSRMDR